MNFTIDEVLEIGRLLRDLEERAIADHMEAEEAVGEAKTEAERLTALGEEAAAMKYVGEIVLQIESLETRCGYIIDRSANFAHYVAIDA